MSNVTFRFWFKRNVKIIRAVMVISFIGMLLDSPFTVASSVIFGLTFTINALLMIWGMFIPNSQLFGFVFYKGTRDRPEIALTFDDGPHPESTPEILDTLRAHEVSATFFVVGEKAADFPSIMKRMVEEGHEIENHTWSHPLTQAVYPLHNKKRIVRDLRSCNETLERLSGRTPAFVRFPAGVKSLPLMEVAHELDLIVTGFSVRAFDSTGTVAPDRLRDRILSRVFPGAIIVLHDVTFRANKEAMTPTIKALPEIITSLKEAGYSFINVSELYEHFSQGTVTGT